VLCTHCYLESEERSVARKSPSVSSPSPLATLPVFDAIILFCRRLVGANNDTQVADVPARVENATGTAVNLLPKRPLQKDPHPHSPNLAQNVSRSPPTKSPFLRHQTPRPLQLTSRSTPSYPTSDLRQTTTSTASTSSVQGPVLSLPHISTARYGGRTLYEHAFSIPPSPRRQQQSALSIDGSSSVFPARHSSIVTSRTNCIKRRCGNCRMTWCQTRMPRKST
jgi:hypothetical protein